MAYRYHRGDHRGSGNPSSSSPVCSFYLIHPCLRYPGSPCWIPLLHYTSLCSRENYPHALPTAPPVMLIVKQAHSRPHVAGDFVRVFVEGQHLVVGYAKELWVWVSLMRCPSMVRFWDHLYSAALWVKRLASLFPVSKARPL